MNPNLKTSLILLGLLAMLLLASQLTMGLLIVRAGAGHPIPYDYPLPKLIKMHQHSGYLTVGVAFLYVLASLAAIVRLPRRATALPLEKS